MTTSPSDTDHFLQRAYALADEASARHLYDEWSGAYDAHLGSAGYASPRRAVLAVTDNLSPASRPDTLTILDAGCGTGLVGDCLARSSLAGHLVLDGLDLSAGMLAVARSKGTYRHLGTGNLNERIGSLVPGTSYDVVICVGTLTKGHVGPGALSELARLTADEGLIVATVHADIWESGGYRAQVEAMQRGGVVRVLGTDEFGILEEESTGGRMVVLRKASRPSVDKE